MGMETGLYIHLPFCVRKCSYCDFLSFPASEDVRQSYLQVLMKELSAHAAEHPDTVLRTVYVGGGTPSLMRPAAMDMLFGHIRETFRPVSSWDQIEITMEVNPGTVDRDKFAAMKRAGVNRLSIGVQSADDEELRRLGRIHTFREAEEAFYAAREAGFDNISLDLMSGIPGQSEESFRESVRKILALRPEHLSVYSLILEPGTPFYRMYVAGEDSFGNPVLTEKGKQELPDEELDRALYLLTGEMLADAGYHRYEISNYALPGKESVHNSSYWRRIPYIGAGLGASGFLQDVRWRNTDSLQDYLSWDGMHTGDLQMEQQQLDRKDAMEEMLFLGLRMADGVAKDDFRRCFGEDLSGIYGDVIRKHIEEGLLLDDGDRIFLTERGMDLANYVLSDFIIDED